MSEVERGRNIKAYPARTPRPFNPLAADVHPLPRPMTILHIPLPPHFSFNQIPYYTVYSQHLRHAIFTMDYGRFPSDDLGTIMSTSVFKYVLLIDTHLLLNPLLTWSADFSPHKHDVLFFASLQISASLFAVFLDYLSMYFNI